MIRRNNGEYRLDHAVTRKQKVILSAFGISEDDVINAAAEISQLLASNKGLTMSNENVDDADEEEVGFDVADEDDFIY